MSHLRHLGIGWTRITDFGVSHLDSLTQLESIAINETSVTDLSVDTLIQLKKLKILILNGTKITDDGYSKLKAGLPACEIRYW
jgi:hypothetical protein